MNRDTPQDLRDQDVKTRKISIPLNVALVVAIILALSGILIAILVPDMRGETNEEPQADIAQEGATVFLSSTVDAIQIGTGKYDNIPIPTAVDILMSTGEMEDRDALKNEIIPMLDFIFQNMTARIKFSAGTGWEENPEEFTITTASQNTDPDHQWTSEVTVGIDDNERSLVVELSLWEVKGP